MDNKISCLTLLLLLVAVPVTAEEDGLVIMLDTKVASLPAGAHVRIEMTARYQVVEFPHPPATATSQPAASIVGPRVQYASTSKDVFRWEFVVDKNGTAPPKQFRFRFPKLNPPPAGLKVDAAFPVKFTLTCPEKSACQSRSETVQFGAFIGAEAPKILRRCLQITEPQVGFGVHADCGNIREKGLLKVPRSH